MRTKEKLRLWLAIFIIAFAIGAGVRRIYTGPRTIAKPRVETRVTFNLHVAPILYGECASCHRPPPSPAFNLTTYADAARHAERIVKSMENGTMPPWLPERGHIPFVGQRESSPGQVSLVRTWLEQGKIEGESADLPPVPAFPNVWALGTPDAVLDSGEIWGSEASGTELVRFVPLRNPLEKSRRVRAVEFIASEPAVIQQAWLVVLPASLTSRASSPLTWAGEAAALARFPEGALPFWIPGQNPLPALIGARWELTPADQLALAVRFTAGTERSKSRVSVGLFFEEGPATLYNLKFGAQKMGERSLQPDSLTSRQLPAEATALGIFVQGAPGLRQVEAKAVLPNGQAVPLLFIPRWIPRWAEAYRYSVPAVLPKGTVISVFTSVERPVGQLAGADSVNPPQVFLQLQVQDAAEFARLIATPGPIHEASKLGGTSSASPINLDSGAAWDSRSSSLRMMGLPAPDRLTLFKAPLPKVEN